MRIPRVFLMVTAMLLPGLHAQENAPKIRDFDIKTIEALGRRLYLQDDLASRGSDAMLAKYPESGSITNGGWITIPGAESSTVYFLQEKDAAVTLAYEVTFPKTGDPSAKDVRGEPVPAEVLPRYHARKAAFAAVEKLLTRVYNFEVLDDPTGKGFIVYALASTQDPNEIMVGRHYRISVSPDAKVTAVDALSNSMLILQKQSPDVPKDAKTVAYSVSHLVSNTPVETHVYLSLLHGMPFYVGTMDNNVWKVENGSITKMDADAMKAGKK
jgi:hypothetical protein